MSEPYLTVTQHRALTMIARFGADWIFAGQSWGARVALDRPMWLRPKIRSATMSRLCALSLVADPPCHQLALPGFAGQVVLTPRGRVAAGRKMPPNGRLPASEWRNAPRGQGGVNG